MTAECDLCGREFASKRGLSVHQTTAHDSDKAYTDAETLKHLYCEKGMSMREVADELGTDHDRVAYWMDIHDIETRPSNRELRYAPYKSNHQGYPLWKTHVDGTHHRVKVHRLLAVAEYGYAAVVDNDVHHKNGVKWDNRPGNITPIGPNEHRRRHGLENADKQRELMQELRENGRLNGGEADV